MTSFRKSRFSPVFNIWVGPFSFLWEDQVTLMLKNKRRVWSANDFEGDQTWRGPVQLGGGTGYVSVSQLDDFLP